MTLLKSHEKAPDFSGIDQDEKTISLHDFRGKKVILYFYPKDDTPGCTAEACNLKENYQALLKNGYVVIGVSPDAVASHKKFALKYTLPFPLIADTDKTIINAYGVWAEKKFMGKTYMGVLRTTFVIDEQGMIEEIIEKVDTKHHTSQIMPES